MKIGARVFAENEQVEGFGSIIYIASSKEFFPVQIELEKGDDSGHKIYRFAWDNVKEVERTKPKRYIAEVNKRRQNYRIGDNFIITDKKENGYYDVYMREYPNKGPVGSYVTNFFKKIEPFIEPKIAEIEPEASQGTNTLTMFKRSEREPETKQKTAINKQGVQYDQLSLFDF